MGTAPPTPSPAQGHWPRLSLSQTHFHAQSLLTCLQSFRGATSCPSPGEELRDFQEHLARALSLGLPVRQLPRTPHPCHLHTCHIHTQVR